MMAESPSPTASNALLDDKAATATTTSDKRTRRTQLTLDLSHVNGGGNHQEASETEGNDDDPPGGLRGLAVTYAAFFFAGASTVAMWSAITLSLDFFTGRYPDERVGFVFPVVNMSTLLVTSLYMVLAGRQLPLAPRIHGAVGLYLTFVLLLPLVNVLDLGPRTAYVLTLLALMGATLSSSVMQASMYGLAGVFGPLFIQALDGGKGFGAILLFIVRLGLKWHYQQRPPSGLPMAQGRLTPEQVSMGLFFGVAASIVASTWGLYVAMTRTPYARPLLREYLLVQHATPFGSPVFSPIDTPMTGSPRKIFRFPSGANERSPLLRSGATNSERSPLPRSGGEHDPEAIVTRGDSYYLSTDDDRELTAEDTPGRLQQQQQALGSVTIPGVFRTAAKPFFTLFLSFFVCLSCFPGIISAIPSTTLGLGDWFPVVLVGCYNLGDLVGKSLPVRVLYFDLRTLHRPWLLQLAFVPVFLALLVRPISDGAVILGTLALGLVTGYVATSSMILAPSACHELQREVAGMIASLCAIIGLCAGSYNGLALVTMVQLWQGA